MMKNQQAYQRRQMAALLRRRTDRILEDWEAMARAHIPVDKNLSRSLLRNALRELLGNLANALETPKWRYHVAKNVEIALEHGRQRHGLDGHDFDQVVGEYAELRKAVVRNVASDAHCTAEGVEVIHEFVDASIKHACGLFAALRCLDDKRALAEDRDLSCKRATELEREQHLRANVISMLGHDMRTPLTSALLAAQTLARNLAAQNQKKAGRIIQSLDRLNAMLQNLLDADHLGAAGVEHPVEIRSCNLSDLIAAVHREMTEMHGTRFVAEIPDHIEGYWDGSTMIRLVENLASNAVKYGASDMPILLQLKKEGALVEITVHNEGDPIPAHVLPSLFAPRFRTREATQSAVVGWGLGLAFVKAVAMAHGGTASADSAEGRGTTFRVRLPIDCRNMQRS